MKLIQFNHQEDFGHDFYFRLLQVNRWCLIQFCFSLMEFGRSWPYFNMTLGSGRLFGFSFQVLWFGVTIELISRSWFK